MKLRTRFVLLFTIIVVSFAAIGVYTFYSLQRIRNMMEVETQITELYNIALEMKKDENDFRTYDLILPEFYIGGASAHISSFENNYLKASKLSSNLKKLNIRDNSVGHSQIDSIVDFLTDYSSTFHIYAGLRKEFGFKDWGIIGEMRKSVHDIEREINKQDMPALGVRMLMLRRHEKDYLLRREEALITKLTDEYQMMKSDIASAPLNRNIKNSMDEKLDNYFSTFMLLVSKDQQIGISQGQGITGQLNREFEYLLESIVFVKQIVVSSTGKLIQRNILMLIIFILSFSLLAIASGLFILKGILEIMGGEPEQVAQIARNVAKGKIKMDLDESKAYKGMMKSVVQMTEKLTGIIGNINHNASLFEISSRQFAQSAQHISQGTYIQASSIDEISATVEQLSKSTDENAKNAEESDRLASFVLESVGQIKNHTDNSVEAGKKVSEKLKIVNSIATQTTILALNAAVEAARAGKNGAGFQVIAGEVKRLAEVSKDAAAEINIITSKNLSQAENVNKLVQSIMPSVEKTSGLVNQISLASADQSNGIVHVKQAVDELIEVSQENASAAEEMAASSSELQKQANELIEMVSFFKIKTKTNVIFGKTQKNKEKINKVIRLWKKNPKIDLHEIAT